MIYKAIRDDDGRVIDLIFDDLNSFAAMRLDGTKEEFIGKKRSEVRGSDNEKEILENVPERYRNNATEMRSDVLGTRKEALYLIILLPWMMIMFSG